MFPEAAVVIRAVPEAPGKASLSFSLFSLWAYPCGRAAWIVEPNWSQIAQEHVRAALLCSFQDPVSFLSLYEKEQVIMLLQGK